MTSRLIATFLLLVFVAAQSYAGICASACQEMSAMVESPIVKVNLDSHDCHSQPGGQKSENSEASQNCTMTVCLDANTQVRIVADQVKEKDGIKQLLVSGEKVVPNVSWPFKSRLLTYNDIPLVSKNRIHLLNQVFRD